ncbi:uncharacterized protein [Cicer arietinum]|uniref:Uncharacterized protein LOC101500074 isoform X2 n=1 Tax=Cicer arietinum TaxID=3827 RepID=A0A1S2Z0P4_CICAR|nr:uncharacterized protein LOC101500074 isoform X2 [Cicer arietinum]
MPCSKEEALVRLFYNASSSFQLLFLFIFSSSILLLKFLNFISTYPLFQREHQYEYVSSEYDYEEEEQEEIQENYSYEDSFEKDHLVADIICGGESLLFLHNNNKSQRKNSSSFEDEEEFITPQDSLNDEYLSEETFSVHHKSPLVSDFETETNEEEFHVQEDADSVPNRTTSSPITMKLYKSDELVDSDKKYDEEHVDIGIIKNKKVHESNNTRDERFFVIGPTQLETKKLIIEEKDDNDEEIYGDSCTVGSTSKNSSDWRSSIICRDSGTDDPFSSSSRRSCPKWESYTVFQKYDEEMSFLDRISAQKLHETESLRSIKVAPRSISGRIVYKFSTMNKKPSDHNPYSELEAAYVAQICLTWEALNWNYKNFQSKRASHVDVGCPETIAQQFQQFQVLLQRYVENEPYEHGRRPEIYARMRHLAPKLLLVPEYRESDDDQKDNECMNLKISSASFLVIMEDGIRTFMSFLKADKEKACQIIAAYFRKNQRGLVDPTLIRLMKKINQKKKMKVKDLRRSHKCLRKRKLKNEEEMEILMSLIDLKVVSRVLRMSDINENQLHWCEEKISKVRVIDGKLQRDSTPLFFPSH